MNSVYRYNIYNVPDKILVQCLQMFKSTITQDFVRCKKTKPNDAWVFPFVCSDNWNKWEVYGWGLLEFEDDTGIIQIFVDEDHRRIGVGKEIFKQMEEFTLIHGKKIGYFVSDKESKHFFGSMVNKASNV